MTTELLIAPAATGKTVSCIEHVPMTQNEIFL